VGPAPRATVSLPLEITARHLEHGVGEEIPGPPPEAAELDAFGVPKKPRRLMVDRFGTIILGGDPEHDLECAAVRAHRAAGRWRGPAVRNSRRHDAKIPRCSRRLASRGVIAIIVNFFTSRAVELGPARAR